ncbi:unnamed protein product [Enterobius vermicularis]|uniref:UBX domain-containing protein n=1 Tax=Enterobius vermicularis TaxID=51028 RepID=A0A0N4VMR9_ENTVE|nr:unnamed protein product [Enterobius vermicularis]
MSEDSTDHEELIHSVMEVCAVMPDVAEKLLQSNGWDIESAVQAYFQNSGASGGWEETENIRNIEQELRHRHVVANGPSTSSTRVHNESASAFIPRQRVSQPPLTWLQWTINLLKLPFDFAYHCFLELLQFSWTLFRGRPLAIADPRGDIEGFIEDFNQRFADARDKICWMNSSYSDALNECKRNLRFMLVYLHNPSHEACDRFVREKLLTRQMKELIDQNNIVLWGASVRTQEGYKVSMALRENTYPFLGLICMRDNRMVMVLRIEGEYDLESMVLYIQTAIDENQIHLNAIRQERQQREADSRIRREQEADYQRGLAADRAKMDEKRKEELARKQAIEKAEEEKRLLERKLERFAEIKERLKKEIPTESEDSDSVRVNVRFPCGARFERKFSLDESLEVLFVSTLVHEKCPMNFSMYTSYPRKQLSCAPEWYREFGDVFNESGKIQTFREAAFEKTATVLVQDNDA